MFSISQELIPISLSKHPVSSANSSHAKQMMICVAFGHNLKQQFYSNRLKKCCILNIRWHCVVTVTSVQRSGACLKTFGGMKGTLDVYIYLF